MTRTRTPPALWLELCRHEPRLVLIETEVRLCAEAVRFQLGRRNAWFSRFGFGQRLARLVGRLRADPTGETVLFEEQSLVVARSTCAACCGSGDTQRYTPSILVAK